MQSPCAEVLCPCSSLIEVGYEHGSGRHPDAVIVWKTGYIDALLAPAVDKVPRFCCLGSGDSHAGFAVAALRFHAMFVQAYRCKYFVYFL